MRIIFPIFAPVKMKKINPILLLFLVLNYTFYQAGILVNYVIDIEAYTEAFCENIDQPELKCHGTCHLTKVLAETEDEKQNNHHTSTPTEILQLYLPGCEELTIDITPEDLLRRGFYYMEFFPEEVLLSTFHPPDFIG